MTRVGAPVKDTQAAPRQQNPSAWPRRIPVIAFAVVGAALSTYLTLYQWRLIGGVWDPIFGSASSEAVLTSFVSRALPLPDATMGAGAYVLEALTAALGGPTRWRTHPRLVLLFGAVASALAVSGIGLAGVQAFALHAGCTLCITSAVISVINARWAVDEVTAAVRGLRAPDHTSGAPARLRAHRRARG